MKRKKDCICITLILLILLSVPVFANDSEPFNAENTQVVALTSEVLAFIEPEKALYGLKDVDFEGLGLGPEIPAFMVEGGKLIECEEISYYPIINDGVWVATSVVSYDNNDEMVVQISTEYAKAYESCGRSNKEIALVFDSTAAYIFTDNTLWPAASAINHVYEGDCVKDVDITRIPKTAKLDSQYVPIVVSCSTVRQNSGLRNYNTQYYINVPIIQMASGTMQCWAACIASIRSYFGTPTTISDVYTYAQVNVNSGADMDTVETVLNGYGFSISKYWWDNLTFAQLRSELYYNDNPIYASVTLTGTNYTIGHAVVIRGYYVYQNINQVGIISYMDPASSYYLASTVASEYSYVYVPAGSSTQYSMVHMWAVSD